MSYFISSDYHLGHFNIIKYANRPFSSIEEMNEVIIRNHNSRIKKNDVFIHNGDFAMVSANQRGNGTIIKAAEYLERLNGIPILLEGNHDRNRGNSVRTKIQSLILSGPGYQIKVVHKPIHADPSYPLNLVGHVHQGFHLVSFQEYYNWQKAEAKRTDLPTHYLNSVRQFVDKWRAYKKDSILLNVGVDVNRFMPLSFEEVICLYNKFKKETHEQ